MWILFLGTILSDILHTESCRYRARVDSATAAIEAGLEAGESERLYGTMSPDPAGIPIHKERWTSTVVAHDAPPGLRAALRHVLTPDDQRPAIGSVIR